VGRGKLVPALRHDKQGFRKLTIVKFDLMSAGLTTKVGGIVALARRKRFEVRAESRAVGA
jgi:hypothetical protein